MTSSVWLGCSDSESAAEQAADAGAAQGALLAPPAVGTGVQFSMVTTLEAGVEAEHCRFVVAPAEGMLVQRDDVRYTAGGHHVLVYDTAYGVVPTKTRDGKSVDTSAVFDCSDGATADWEVTKLLTGAQNGRGESMLELPPNVGLRVRPSAVLLINMHCLNTASEPIYPEVRVNLYTLAESELQHEADVLLLYNDLIKVPAAGSARARMRCPIHQDRRSCVRPDAQRAPRLHFALAVGCAMS